MAEDYIVTHFKAGDYKDPNNNWWCEMALQGVSEPVRIAVRDPQQFHEGMTLYGTVNDATSKAGKPYLRFKREKKEDAEPAQPQHSVQPDKPDGDYWEDKNAAIKAQWAIGQAVQLTIANGKLSLEAVEADAKRIFAMANRVKEGTTADAPLKASPAENSGYNKFKQSKPKTEAEKDAEAQSLYETAASSIDIGDIPF